MYDKIHSFDEKHGNSLSTLSKRRVGACTHEFCGFAYFIIFQSSFLSGCLKQCLRKLTQSFCTILRLNVQEYLGECAWIHHRCCCLCFWLWRGCCGCWNTWIGFLLRRPLWRVFCWQRACCCWFWKAWTNKRLWTRLCWCTSAVRFMCAMNMRLTLRLWWLWAWCGWGVWCCCRAAVLCRIRKANCPNDVFQAAWTQIGCKKTFSFQWKKFIMG